MASDSAGHLEKLKMWTEKEEISFYISKALKENNKINNIQFFFKWSVTLNVTLLSIFTFWHLKSIKTSALLNY